MVLTSLFDAMIVSGGMILIYSQIDDSLVLRAKSVVLRGQTLYSHRALSIRDDKRPCEKSLIDNDQHFVQTN